MRQGELWYVDLNPTKGSEQKGQRPVLIISGNLLNEHLNVVIACPLTTKSKTVQRKFNFETYRQKQIDLDFGGINFSHSIDFERTIYPKNWIRRTS